MDKQEKQFIYERKKKKTSTAFWLSFFITGTGHMYVGQPGKGAALLIASIMCVLFIWLIAPAFILLFLWIYGVADATGQVEEANKMLKIELGMKK